MAAQVKKAIQVKNQLSSSNLKEQLWNTLKMVKSKKISPEIANSIATQSREIMRIVKMELEIMKFSNKKPTHTNNLISSKVSVREMK